MVVFDTSTIVLALNPNAKPPIDVNTGQPLDRCRERINYLITTLGKAKTSILIPTPVIAEFLVKAGPNKQLYLDTFFASKNFEVGDFNTRAAIDCAHLLDGDFTGRALDDTQTKAKIKFDRQIVAIAKARGAECIYTDDVNLAAVARKNIIAAVMTWELPLPPEPPQISLFANPDEGTW